MTGKFKPYVRFAQVYDIFDGTKFSLRMADYTFQLLKKYHHRPKTVLDLCCGTGTAACLFAEHGYEVTGLDGSEHMLKMAKEKARQMRLPVNFVHQRLPHLRIRDKKEKALAAFDLVTCFYDSLNYILKEEDLKATFRAVNDHLAPGGLFIFDMNTRRTLKLWEARTHAVCRGGAAWIFKSIMYDRASQADLHATFFVQKGKHWDMFEEIHSEKAYPNSTIKRLLSQTGFEILGFFNCFKFHRPTREAYRIAVVARRKS